MRDDVQFVPLTRRRLLGCAFTAGAGIGLAGLAAAPPVAGRASWLRRATFARRVNDPFYATVPGEGTVTLRLAKVGDLLGTSSTGRSLAGRADAFLLELTGPAKPQLTQGAYDLRHRTLGLGRFFVVPHPPNIYAVVVNRA